MASIHNYRPRTLPGECVSVGIGAMSVKPGESNHFLLAGQCSCVTGLFPLAFLFSFDWCVKSELSIQLCRWGHVPGRPPGHFQQGSPQIWRKQASFVLRREAFFPTQTVEAPLTARDLYIGNPQLFPIFPHSPKFPVLSVPTQIPLLYHPLPFF